MNIGVIGSGFIVDTFVKETQKFDAFKLKTIWGRHKEKLDKFKDYFECLTLDLDELLNDQDIDVVYIALPNKLHYEYALKALKANKHVILEKPFTIHESEAIELIEYAKEHNLIIYEAILTRHNPLYLRAIEEVKKLGDIKIISANFTQYSRRYDRFKQGIIEPVFSKEMAGGALLDLNVYNIHFVLGMFGEPKDVHYYPNMENGVDTSGILILEYDTFKATLICSKDSRGENFVLVEGRNGYLKCHTTASRSGIFSLHINNETTEFGNIDEEFGAWKYELEDFIKLYNSKDLKSAYSLNLETLKVVRVLEKALQSANINY